MSTKNHFNPNSHPAQPFDKLRTQPYFLPATVIPLTAFHPAPKPAQPRRVLPWLVRVIWGAMYLAGRVRANEEAIK